MNSKNWIQSTMNMMLCSTTFGMVFAATIAISGLGLTSVDEVVAEPVNAFGLSAPNPKTDGAIRIATYNMLNFFDQVDDPTLEGKYDDDTMITTISRCEVLAKTIHKVDADIIALQEVESLEALTWFRDTFLADMGYTYIASKDVGYYRGIECSLMSRFEITKVTTWPEMTLDDVVRDGVGWEPAEDALSKYDDGILKFQRSPLQCDIKVNDDYTLTVFSIHHKSGGSNRAKREAEALGLLEIVDDIVTKNPNRNVIIMGDFNSAPWDKSLRAYLEAGFVDTMAHRIIPRWKDADQSEAKLYKTHESDRVIDYILMNGAAYREYVPGTGHVFGTLTPPDSYNWKTDPKPVGYASDHYPLIVDIVPDDLP